MYFDFCNIINKYSVNFKALITINKGFNDEGIYINDKEEKELKGAIIGISEGKIYSSNGTLTSKDKRLFVFEKLSMDTEIIFNENRYKVEEEVENAEFTGVYEYVLKYVSAFKKVGDKVD